MNDALAVIALAGPVIFTIAVGFLLVSSPPARGHSWYDSYCCSGSDCAPISGARIQLVTGGYLLDGKHFVPNEQARNSQDGDYHACFWPSPDTLRCFYRPPLGS
jgi:hypothetical protein